MLRCLEPTPCNVIEIARKFHHQLTGYNCGPAAVHLGVLLGGVDVPEQTWASLFGTTASDGTDVPEIIDGLNLLGFQCENVAKPSRLTTEAFFNQTLQSALAGGAFAIACIDDQEHWVAVGDWKDGIIHEMDPYRSVGCLINPEAFDPKFKRLSPEQFEGQDWDEELILCQPGRFADQFRKWLPLRMDLLRSLDKKRRKGVLGLDDIAQAVNMVNSEDYDTLTFFLKKGSAIKIEVSDASEHALAVRDTGDKDLLVLDNIGSRVPEYVVRLSAISGYDLS